MLPAVRPHFISERHFEFLSHYFAGERHYDPLWLQSYIGSKLADSEEHNPDPSSAEEEKDEKVAEEGEKLEATIDDPSSEKQPDASRTVLLYNEFICLNQVFI